MVMWVMWRTVVGAKASRTYTFAVPAEDGFAEAESWLRLLASTVPEMAVERRLISAGYRSAELAAKHLDVVSCHMHSDDVWHSPLASAEHVANSVQQLGGDATVQTALRVVRVGMCGVGTASEIEDKASAAAEEAVGGPRGYLSCRFPGPPLSPIVVGE